MNIEEARKHLKKNLNNWKKSKKDNGYMPEIVEEINTDYEAIETLLTAYEKEKEKNKKLDKENQDKIKAKIEELESQINDIKSNFDYEYDENMVNEVWRLENKISVLQSLLEKE